RVVLLHSGSLILPELPASLGRFAQTLLGRRGVEIRLNRRLTGATADGALLDGGERIATRTLISTVPSIANPLVATLGGKRGGGRIVVDAHRALPDHPGVGALGDCAWSIDARSGEVAPPTAQHATRQARCLADNIVACLRGTPRRAFSFRALGK